MPDVLEQKEIQLKICKEWNYAMQHSLQCNGLTCAVANILEFIFFAFEN